MFNKKLLSIVLSLALIITGMAFMPNSIKASVDPVIAVAKDQKPAEDTVLYWYYKVISGYGGGYKWDVTATINDYDDVDGFNASLSDYSYDGSIWIASGLKEKYNLVIGRPYTCTVTIAETPDNPSQHTQIGVETLHGNTNLAKTFKTNAGSGLSWTGTVVPGKRDLQLKISYGDGNGGHEGGYAGSFEVTSVTFTEQSHFLTQIHIQC